MTPPAAASRLLIVATLALIALSSARADKPDTSTRQPKEGDFVFSLMPKAFQRTPDLEMTVNTELTQFGHLLRTPTPDNPMYYVAHSSGYKPMGDPVGGEKPPAEAQVEAVFKRALAQGGYLPAEKPDQRPTLVILYFWGSHNRMDRETERQFPQLAQKYRLERAMLVGGHSNVERMAQIFEFGENLTDRTPEYEYLRDQMMDDLYYVVASAYDYASLARHDRKLVWRTTMTVAAQGVSMKESMLPLITSAGPYFGRETTDPKILQRRIQRWGVSTGELKVIEADVALPTKPLTPGATKSSPTSTSPKK